MKIKFHIKTYGVKFLGQIEGMARDAKGKIIVYLDKEAANYQAIESNPFEKTDMEIVKLDGIHGELEIDSQDLADLLGRGGQQ